jgi:cell division transport system permease protein
MAIKASYISREVGINLTRNVTLTLATIATVAVSLTLVGTAYLIRQGVGDAQRQFQGGVEFIVFMNPNATDAQIDAVRTELDDNPQVRESEFCDQDCAYAEFQELFADDPGLLESVTADILPPSFRVKPVDADTDAVAALGEVFEGEPGVREVAFSSEAIKQVERFYRFLSNRSAIAAVMLVFAATLLVLNTIQMAIFNRRRDIEVMKLVGATNWFIRVPFMLEGLVQGLIGALLAVGFTRYFIGDLEREAQRGDAAGILATFHVSSGDYMWATIILIAAGAAVSLIGSGIAVSRFLKV